MVKNYLKIAFRNLTKNKFFSAINIAGMTIGMASFFIIGLYVFDELKYDEYHPDKERTFRIYNVRTGNDGNVNRYPIVPPVFAATLKEDFPQIESTLRFMDSYGEELVSIDGDNRFYQSGSIYAETSIFDMLSIKLLQGNPATALKEPNQVAISASFANKHFGKGEAMNSTIRIGKADYTVTGVFQDIPKHSHLQTDMIMSFSTLLQNWTASRKNSWVWQQFFTYIKLKKGSDWKQLEAQLPGFVEKHAYPITKPEGFTYVPHLQRIDDIYLHSSSFEWEIAKRGNITTVYALSAAAIFLIIIVAVNFINLSTARSINRLKEVGVRKVIGAQKKDLIFQFLGESIFLSLISVIIAGFITELAVPYLNIFTGKAISSQFLTEPVFLLAVIGFALILGLLAGAYPAFFASSFKAISIFKKRTSATSSNSLFRKVTVVIQFGLSIFLISAAIIVYQQLSFLRNKDLGFDQEQIVLLPLKDNIRKSEEAIKAEWLKNPGIKSISYCFGLPGQIVAGDGIRDAENKRYPANQFMVDYDYLKTLGLQVIAGRDFDENLSTDATSAFIINETAVKNLGFSSPEKAIGQALYWNMWVDNDSVKQGQVIGVVKDFHFKSLRDELTSTVLQIYPAYSTIAIKLNPGDPKATLSFLESQWKTLEPNWPFTYEFMDQNLTSMYKSERQLGYLFTFFTGLGIFIACLGLFGLVYYTTAQRIKEIGIRKVLGAGASDIVFLINKSFLWLMALGLLMAAPVCYYLAQNWLGNFAYKVTISPMTFVYAGLVMAAFALLTVSFQSIKAALTNPVDTLKEE